MTRSPLKTTASRLMLVAALAGLGLSACNKASDTNNAAQDAAQAPAPQAALPLDTGAAPPLAPAPSATALPPPARPLRYGRLARPGDSYVFAERAYGLNHAFGDAPPDYTFDYDGVRPWVWRSDAGAIRVVERLASGDRYYYYEPGADAPYLVRDPNYSYAYDQGELVAVYGGNGRLLDEYDAQRQADRAARYYDRGQGLYDYSRRGQHVAVARDNWRERRDEIARERRQWANDAQQQPDWRTYHDQYGVQEESRWDDERYRRQSEAARVATAIGDIAAVALLTQEAQKARDHQHDDRRGQGPQNGYGDQQTVGSGNAGGQPYAGGQPSNQGRPDNGGQRRESGRPNAGPGFAGGQANNNGGPPNVQGRPDGGGPRRDGGRPNVGSGFTGGQPNAGVQPNGQGGPDNGGQRREGGRLNGSGRPAEGGQRPVSPANSGAAPNHVVRPAPAAPPAQPAPQPHREQTPAPTGFNAPPRAAAPTPPAPVHAQAERPTPPAAPPSRAAEAQTHLRALPPPPHAAAPAPPHAAVVAPAPAKPAANPAEIKRHPGEGEAKHRHPGEGDQGGDH